LSLFVDYFLYGIVMPLMPHSPANIVEEHLGLLYGGYAVSVLVVTPLFGYLGDRVGGRPIMICGMVLAGRATTLFAMASNFPLSLLARLCQGAASGRHVDGRSRADSRALCGEARRDDGVAFTGSTAGSALGPLAGGLLYHIGGYQLPFLATGVLVVSPLASLPFFFPRERRAEKRTSSSAPFSGTSRWPCRPWQLRWRPSLGALSNRS
jgi:MFS family permease